MIEKCTPYDVVVIGSGGGGLRAAISAAEEGARTLIIAKGKINRSGSTLLACEQTKRRCYMIELDEKFCDVIVKRYIEQVGSDERVTVTRNGKTYTYTEMEAT